MFASAGLVLKLHIVADHHLEPIAIYKPRKSVGSKIINLTWCHDNNYIALLQEDSFPQIISSKDRTNIELVHTVQALKKVSAIKFKQHTKRAMALGNTEGEGVLYDTRNRNILKKFCELNSPIKCIEFNSNDLQLAVATEKSVVLFTDHEADNNFLKVASFSEICSTIKYHPAISHILGAAYNNGCVTLRDIEKEEVVANFQKHCAPVTGINFTGNQKVIVTTGLDKKICVYDYGNGECIFRMNVHQAITSSDISLDDVCVAVGLEDGSVLIYDIRDPLKPLTYSNAHNCPVTSIAFEKTPMFYDHLQEKVSGTTLVDSDFEDQSEAVKVIYEMDNNPEDKLKQDIMRMIKNNMDYLEAQLNDHCTKFQNFIMNEFDSIQNAMNRWDVFNVGDSSDITRAINSPDSKSVKSSFTKKSHLNN